MRKIKGARRVKSLLKRIEPAMRDEMIVALTGAGRELAAAMNAAAPVLKKPRKGRIAGALRTAFTFRIYAKTLRMTVGLLGRPANRTFFYAGILERGRGIKKVIDRRGHRIGIIQPIPIVFASRADLRRALGGRIRGIWGRALQVAAAGAGNADD